MSLLVLKKGRRIHLSVLELSEGTNLVAELSFVSTGSLNFLKNTKFVLEELFQRNQIGPLTSNYTK
jgi:hypothetical protein